MVRQWQEMFFEKRYSFTHMQNPDFIAISNGYGIPAKLCKEKKDLEKSVDEFLLNEKHNLLEVRVEKENNIFPMISTGAAINQVKIE